MLERSFFAERRYYQSVLFGSVGLAVLALLMLPFGRVARVDLTKRAEEKRASVVEPAVNFSLFGEASSFPLPDIDKTILPLAVNTRPDRPTKPEVLMQVGEERLRVKVGERVYLTFHAGVEVAKEPTSFWIENRLEEKGLSMEVGLKVLENEKRRVFRFEDLPQDATITPSQLLKEAVLMGPDRLLELYGGAAYQKDKGKMRLKLPGHALLFVKKGDRLALKDGRWDLGMEEKAPLIEVIDMSPVEASLMVWSGDGLSSELVKLTTLKAVNVPPRPQALFTKLRKKTATTVSCRLGQKPALLKKGDWLLRTKAGWRFIKTQKEIADCLSLKLQGELFVCDGVEKNHLVGTLFDVNRTQSQVIRLPLGETKKP